MADFHGNEVGGEEEDYYAMLNVSRKASDDDINAAFRRISRIYHPDRHFDPEDKKDAETFFRRIQKAHSVLSDPSKRAIYDTVGSQAVHLAGWELVPQLYTANQVREEYERLRRQADNERIMQRANPSGNVSVQLNATDLMRPVTDAEVDDGYLHREFPYVEFGCMSVSQSIEGSVTSRDRLVVTGHVQTQNGTGAPTLTCSWRRIIDQKMWTELSCTVGPTISTALKLTRTVSKRMFLFVKPTVQCNLQALTLSDAFDFGLELSVNQQLERNVTGVLSGKLGTRSHIATTLMYDDRRLHSGLCGLVVGLPSTYVQMSYSRRVPRQDASATAAVNVGTFGLLASARYNMRLNACTTATCSCRLLMPNASLNIKLKVSRASHTYALDVVLCDSADYVPSALLIGVLLPSALVLLLRNVLGSRLQSWWQTDDLEHRRRLKETLQMRRQQAERTIELMQATADRLRANEEDTQGLVITEAVYGHLIAQTSAFDYQNRPSSEHTIDVTVPLQTLVAQSKLIICDANKSQLPGFFDPCPDETKMLSVRYRFRGREHRVVLADHEPVLLPKQSHQL